MSYSEVGSNISEPERVNATLAGSKIKVVVTDKPGNTTSFEKSL